MESLMKRNNIKSKSWIYVHTLDNNLFENNEKNEASLIYIIFTLKLKGSAIFPRIDPQHKFENFQKLY